MWKALAEELAKDTPVISSILQGESQLIIISLANLIGFTINVDPIEKEILKAIRNDPENIDKLKQLEVTKEKLLLKWQNQQISLELTKKTTKPGWKESSIGTYLISFLIIFGFFYAVLFVLGKPNMEDVSLILLGQLGGAFTSVITYYLGSSKGHDDNIAGRREAETIASCGTSKRREPL